MSEQIITALPGGMMTTAEAAGLIEAGEHLVVAGSGNLLQQLPAGNWIGGTIPYFMGPDGGGCTESAVFVNRLDNGPDSVRIKEYDVTNLDKICVDAPENGYSLIILPAFSEVHAYYARNAPGFEDMFIKPVIGWVAGIKLGAEEIPRVFNGQNNHSDSDMAVVMHVTLPATSYAYVDIINSMHQGNGPGIRFPATGFSVTDAIINGKEQNFATYLTESGADTHKPLVADYCGAQINVSIKNIDTEAGRVEFYAPVFSDSEYRLAEGKAPDFSGMDGSSTTFSCNCILNYLYEELEGKHTAGFMGPMTFGEIAYLLLNQTLVHMTIIRN